MTSVVLCLAFIFFGIALYDHILPVLHRIANAQEEQAEALKDIAYALETECFDDDETGDLSDATRVVEALERLASVPAPASTPPTDEKTE